MKRGDLVPDETVLDRISDRLGYLNCSGGFLPDGFPRTVARAKGWKNYWIARTSGSRRFSDYELAIEQFVARLSGRRSCSDCMCVYHVITRPPKAERVCDHCGGALIQREDDRPESVKMRMEAYLKSTKPLIDFYKQRGLLVTITAYGSPEEIYQRAWHLTMEG